MMTLEQKIKRAQELGIRNEDIQLALGAKKPKEGGFKLSDIIPIIGTLAGGAIGSVVAPGAGTVIGAGLGSASGESIRQQVAGEDPSLGKIAKEGAYGLAGGVAGEVLGAGARIAGKAIGSAAGYTGKAGASTFLKLTPSNYAKAADAGVDLNKVFMKYLPKIGNNYDEMLGVVEKGSQGSIGRMLGEAEDVINITAKTAKGTKFTGKEIINALDDELKVASTKLGEKNKVKALKDIITQVKGKYKGGISPEEAVKIVKDANHKFGDSILKDTTASISDSAQKIEADVLRKALKSKFPAIREALDQQQELILLQKSLKAARAKAGSEGIPRSIQGLLNRTIASPTAGRMITKGSSVASKLGEKMTTSDLLKKLGLLGAGTAGVKAISGNTSEMQPAPQGTTQPSEDQTQDIRQMMAIAMLADLKSTGGKRITQLKTVTDMLQPKLTAQQTKDKNNAESGLRALDTVVAEMQSNPLALYLAALPGSPGARKFETAKKEAADVITRLRTGAAINENEEKFYKSQLPSAFDGAETINYKINLLRELFSRVASPQSSAGLDAGSLEF